MKQISRLMMLGAMAIAGQAFAQEWTFTPELYSRGDVTYKSDFSKEMGSGDQVIKDREAQFFKSESARRSTHFVRFYYEVKIN